MNNETPTHRDEQRPRVSPAVIALALLTALVSVRTISNSDFWLHLAVGRQVSEHGLSRFDPFSFATAGQSAWIHATWLYDWLLHVLWRLGQAPLVITVHALAAGAAFAIMLAASRGPARGVLLAGLPALWLAAPQLVVRPTLPAFLCAALTLWLVRRPWSCTRLLAYLLPLQWLWTNVHLTFLLGPLLVLLAAVDEHLTGRAAGDTDRARVRARTRTLFISAGAAAAVSVLNPRGLRLHLQAVSEFLHPAEGWLLEWVSPFASLFDQGWLRILPTLVLAFIALGFVLHRQRMPWFESVLGVVSAFLIVWSPQHVEWCALLALPFLLLSANALLDLVERRLPPAARAKAGRVAVGIGAAAVLLSAWPFLTSAYYRDSGSASRFGWGRQDGLYAFDATRLVLAAPGFPDQVYNLPLDGGARLWSQPDRKILVDARTQVYGLPFLRDFNLALRGDQERWNDLNRRWPVEAFVFNCCWGGSGSTIRSLLVSRQWSLVYFDGTSAVLMPALRRNLTWLRNHKLQQAGLALLEQDRKDYAEAVARGEHPPNPPRLIGGASFLQSVGLFREASSLYSLLARGSPQMTGAWLNLGICLVQQGDPAQAIPVLEYMRGRLPKHVMVHLWLSRAYRETGKRAEADEAFAKALTMDRAVSEAFAGLTQTNRLPNTMLDGGRSLR